jgi:hypothetical protein
MVPIPIVFVAAIAAAVVGRTLEVPIDVLNLAIAAVIVAKLG